MKQLTDDLFVLEGFPPYAINVYIAGTVLIDAGTRFDARRIVRRGAQSRCDCARSFACTSGPPGREPCGVRSARDTALVWRGGCLRDGDAR